MSCVKSATTDIIGIVVGHLYFYLEDILPEVGRIRGWRWRRPLKTPGLLHFLCGTRLAGTAGGGEGAAVVEDATPAWADDGDDDDDDGEEQAGGAEGAGADAGWGDGGGDGDGIHAHACASPDRAGSLFRTAPSPDSTYTPRAPL